MMAVSSLTYRCSLWMLLLALSSLLLQHPRRRLILTVAAARSMATSASFAPNKNLKGLFVGSGSDGMNEPRICQAVLDLVKKQQHTPTDTVNILYLGTATYDLPQFYQRQTEQFVQLGCKAHAIVVGGGNTLYAVDKWKQLGIDMLLRQAMERGVVLAGGSAGAICWFDGGHSDSMDPDTYRQAMMEKYSKEKVSQESRGGRVEESSSAPSGETARKDWAYIRVPGLAFLPGLVCPHYDKTQSNGVLRAHDFQTMLRERHAGEVGIGIDHWAALLVDGDSYRVLSLEGKPGTVLPNDEFSATRQGVPGVWIHRIDKSNGAALVTRCCPAEGQLADILQPAIEIFEDPRVEQCRRENPSSQ